MPRVYVKGGDTPTGSGTLGPTRDPLVRPPTGADPESLETAFFSHLDAGDTAAAAAALAPLCASFPPPPRCAHALGAAQLPGGIAGEIAGKIAGKTGDKTNTVANGGGARDGSARTARLCAHLLLGAGRRDLALECIDSVPEDARSDVRVHSLLATLSKPQKNPTSSTKNNSNAGAGDTGSYGKNRGSDEAFVQLAEYSAALSRHLGTFPSDRDAWLERFDCAWAGGDCEAAVFCAEELVVMEPQGYVAHVRLGEALLFAAGEKTDKDGAALTLRARHHFSEALLLHPKSARAALGLLASAERASEKGDNVAKRLVSVANKALGEAGAQSLA